MDKTRLTFGVALERLGIWAIALVAIWFGTTVRDLTKEVSALRESLATVSSDRRSDSVRIDKIDAKLIDLGRGVDNLYDLQQWHLETFHGYKTPKPKH